MLTAPFPIQKARHETPGCRNVIHFNNAGASLMPQPVIEAVQNYWKLESMIGGYEAAKQEQKKIENVYTSVAKLINCTSEEIAVVENATYAWSLAFYSIPFQKGDKILTSIAEYASNYIAFLQVAKKTGVRIAVIPNDEFGQVSVEALASMIDSRVKLIAITHIPTNGGLVNPAAAIGKLARQAGVLYLLDACQSVGQYPIDVREIGCDMLSATGRKYLRAPRGTGFLYVRKELIETLEPVMLDLHAATWLTKDTYAVRPDACRFENFESNIGCKIGLGVAIDYLLSWGTGIIWLRVTALAQLLRQQLTELPEITVHDQGIEQCGIVTFTIKGISPPKIQEELQKRNINVWVSFIGSARLDMEARGLEQLVRASVHYYNTEEEIAISIKAIKGIIRSKENYR